MVRVDHHELELFVRRVLVDAGAAEDVATEVAAQLVRADASGRGSHGTRSLRIYVDGIRDGRIDPQATVETVADHGSIVVLDGHAGFGQVTGRVGVTLGADRARAHGIACVVARNAGDLGRLGDYTERLAEDGVASIMLANGQGGGQSIVPPGGNEKRLATDPVSLGFPGAPHAAVLDIALSAAAARRVHVADERGERVPEGWIVDAKGNPSTDPADYASGGRLLPLGWPAAAHKGYGLIVLADLLVGVLSGGGVRGLNAYLLIAIDVGRVVPRDEALAAFGVLRDHVLSAGPDVRLPGEGSAEARQRAESEGVPLDPATWRSLDGLAAGAGIELPAQRSASG